MSVEGRARLAVLEAAGRVDGFWEQYVLKGGLVLHHVYGSPRHSDDLDFDAVAEASHSLTAEKDCRLVRLLYDLDAALAYVAPARGFAAMHVQHRRLSDLLPTVMAEVGFAEAAAQRPPLDAFVELQVTLSEAVCETARAEVEGIPLRIASLEDILAGKLKAMLQAALRDRTRSADVYDVWYFQTRERHPLDLAKLTEFLRCKAEAWDDLPPPQRSHFRTPIVREHAAADWAALADRLEHGADLPAFDEAFNSVLALVDRLDLPA